MLARLSHHLILSLFLLLMLNRQVDAQSSGGRPSDTQTQTITMNVGEQVSLPRVGVAQYSEGDTAIAELKNPSTGDSFILFGRKAGNTSVVLLMQDGSRRTINVVVRDPNARGGNVSSRENIRLDFYFVQLSESRGHQLGIGWPGSIGGGTDVARFNLLLDLAAPGRAVPAGGTAAPVLSSATLQIANHLLPRLDLAQVTGWAKIMRQAMVVAANGVPAEFTSGGEVNVQVQGALTAEIRTIPYGSNIKVTPRYDQTSGRVEISIQADVSDLTQSSAGVPGRTRTTLNTVVNLELGQSLVLGGLVGRSTSEQTSGIPGLSQIPILGFLFGSNGQRSDEVENVLFIVPTVVQAASRQDIDRITEALKLYQGFGGLGGRGLGEVQLMETTPPGY